MTEEKKTTDPYYDPRKVFLSLPKFGKELTMKASKSHITISEKFLNSKKRNR
jgi:hypothetical protein